MKRLRRYLELQAQAKSGLSSAFVVGVLLGLASAGITFAFLLVAVFVWLARRYDALAAGLSLGGLFLLITIIALASAVYSRRRTIERAERALAAQRQTPWLDPRLVGTAVQMSRAVGLRKVLPLVAIAILAAGAAMQWNGAREHPDFQ
jgi:uncharacterized membrane protein YqjE